MGRHAHAGTEPQNRAGVLGNVGLVKRDLHSIPIALAWRAVTAIPRGSVLRAAARNMQKSTARHVISALHAGQPIAGLRYSGKGANRTILDCCFLPIGVGKGRSSAAAGHAGAGSLPVTGAVPPARAYER